MLYRIQPFSKENTEERRCHSSRRRAALFHPDSLRLSTQTLEVFRLCGSTVSKETAISNCTGLKQLFVKGQIGVIFRNSQTVLQLSAIKHMDALDGHMPVQKQWSRADTHRNEQAEVKQILRHPRIFLKLSENRGSEVSSAKGTSLFLITLNGFFFHEFVHSHVGHT